MNLIAIDIGNRHITAALFLNDEETSLETVAPVDEGRLKEVLTAAWDRIPVSELSRERKRDGVIVASSVKPEWMELVERIVSEELDEKVKVIGRDVPLPMEMGVESPEKVGTDRVVAAAAAFAVVEDAVAVADFGTAVTVDLVDEDGVFLGGAIAPGFELSARALNQGTAQLPEVKFSRPAGAIGANTEAAINAGLYFSAVGLLRVITEEFAVQLGRWPQLVVTGSGASVIRAHCDFVDNWAPNLVVRGVFLAYAKSVADKNEVAVIAEKLKRMPSDN